MLAAQATGLAERLRDRGFVPGAGGLLGVPQVGGAGSSARPSSCAAVRVELAERGTPRTAERGTLAEMSEQNDNDPHGQRRQRGRHERRAEPRRRTAHTTTIPLPVVSLRRRRLDDAISRAPLSRHARRILGAQLRPLQPASGRRGAGTAGAGHADLPRLPPRPVRRRSAPGSPAVRQGGGAADEHRCGGRGDGREDRPQVGIRRQGRAGRAREDRGRGEQLPRPDHTIVSFSTDHEAPAPTSVRTRRGSRSCRTGT